MGISKQLSCSVLPFNSFSAGFFSNTQKANEVPLEWQEKGPIQIHWKFVASSVTIC